MECKLKLSGTNYNYRWKNSVSLDAISGIKFRSQELRK
jgi:hypothetical protein